MFLKFLERYRNLGLLILRAGIGLMFVYRGWPKISGGFELWKGLGSAMGNLGINFIPEFCGFMSAFAEFFGGIMLILGLLFRPAVILLAFNMFVATLFHFNRGDTLAMTSHAIELGVVFVGLIFIGPGKYSLDEIFTKRK